jgi:hypothetical protein
LAKEAKRKTRERERERKVFPQAAATRYPLLSLVFIQQVNDTTPERNAKERLPKEQMLHEHNVPERRHRNEESNRRIKERAPKKKPFNFVP